MTCKYIVVSNDDFSMFMDRVNQKLADGAVLEGGIAVIHTTGNYPSTRYYQAMTLEVEE